MRYQICDLVIDLILLYWMGFLLSREGMFSMGGVSVFAPLRHGYPNPLLGMAMPALIVLARIGLWSERALIYATARVLAGLFLLYLSWLCILARPISTGVIYSAVALGAFLLASGAVLNHLGDDEARPIASEV